MKKKKLKSKILLNKILIKLTTFLFLFAFGNSVFASELIILSKSSFERLTNYLSKDFFSYVFNNKISNTTALAFYTSLDGENTVLVYCRENDKFLCQLNSPYLYQAKVRCEKSFKKKCKLLLKENYLILNNKKIKIEKADEIKKYIKLKNNNKNTKTYHTDFEVNSMRDSEGCGSSDC